MIVVTATASKMHGTLSQSQIRGILSGCPNGANQRHVISSDCQIDVSVIDEILNVSQSDASVMHVISSGYQSGEN
jgi:hypothetical protein